MSVLANRVLGVPFQKAPRAVVALLYFMLSSALAGLPSAAAFAEGRGPQQSSPEVPKQPEEPFSYLVKTDPTGEKKAVKNVRDAAKELDKKLNKDKKWFRQVDNEADAEIVLDVMAHWVDERSYTRTETRYSVVYGNQLDDVNIMEEQHHVEALVSVFGVAKRMEGVEPYDAGGNAKNAAGNLAEYVQRYVRENYWDLMERRKARGNNDTR